MKEYPVSDQIYKQKLRVRVCGLLVENNRILMLRHKGLGKNGYLWSPPGGGMVFHEPSEDALIREFLEETGLTIEVQNMLFANEVMTDQLHAIEIFFQVKRISGSVHLGNDPEVPAAEQILDDIKWFTFAELDALDKRTVHNVFSHLEHSKNILELRGFYKFVNISG